MPTWQTYLQENEPRLLDELCALVRFPTIGSVPEHLADMHDCAAWLVQRLTAAGLENAAALPITDDPSPQYGGAPFVYADWLHAPGKPTLIIYGHYDVQPVDPLDAWHTPPFEPTLIDGRLYGRGATDNKGQLFATITAVEALLQTEGKLPCNVKFLLEGEEEFGSPHATEGLERWKHLYAADLAVIADGGQYSADQPQVMLGTRGILNFRIEVRGPNADGHSGNYGGSIANPLHALSAIVASFHDDDGRITVDGFYDDVATLTPEERALLARVPFDEQEYTARLGAPLFGEPGFSTYERLWARPTLEINGMCGGYTGDGSKTVLPARAWANCSCRLAPNQEPDKVFTLIDAHVARHMPRGVKVDVIRRPGGAYPYQIPVEHMGNRVADDVLRELYGKDPYWVRNGATLPMMGILYRGTGVHAASMGFSLPDQNVHAPNEFLRLSQWNLEQRAYVRFLQRLGEEQASDSANR